MPKPIRPMKIPEFIRLHAYFIHIPPPLSEPTKEILREIEEHILGVIQKERNPIQTQTNSAHPQTEPKRTHYIPEGF